MGSHSTPPLVPLASVPAEPPYSCAIQSSVCVQQTIQVSKSDESNSQLCNVESLPAVQHQAVPTEIVARAITANSSLLENFEISAEKEMSCYDARALCTPSGDSNIEDSVVGSIEEFDQPGPNTNVEHSDLANPIKGVCIVCIVKYSI